MHAITWQSLNIFKGFGNLGEEFAIKLKAARCETFLHCLYTQYCNSTGTNKAMGVILKVDKHACMAS